MGIYKRTMMTKKILFLHGLCFRQLHTCPNTKASICGQGGSTHSRPALHPNEALVFIENICQQEKPCVLVGNSNGAFLAQIVASRLGIPALLGNPYLEMTRFLIERIGKHEYNCHGQTDTNNSFQGHMPENWRLSSSKNNRAGSALAKLLYICSCSLTHCQ